MKKKDNVEKIERIGDNIERITLNSQLLDNQIDQVPHDIADKYQYMKYLDNQRKRESFEPKVFVSRDKTIKINLERGTLAARRLAKTLPTPEERNAAYQWILDYEKIVTTSSKLLRSARGQGVSGQIKTSLDEYSGIIFEMYGRFFTTAEILDVLVNKYGIKTSHHELMQFRTRNKETIEGIQREKENDYFDVSLSKKRGRAERLEYLYNTANDEIRKASITSALKATYLREMRGIIETARKEFEKDEIKITIEGKLSIDVAIKEQSKQPYLQRTTMCFVLADVAAKNGLNASYLTQKLLRGWYSKWNGIGQFKPDEAVRYPSEFIYGLDDVEHLYLANQQEERDIMLDRDVVLGDRSDMQNVARTKAQILQAINSKRKMLEIKAD